MPSCPLETDSAHPGLACSMGRVLICLLNGATLNVHAPVPLYLVRVSDLAGR